MQMLSMTPRVRNGLCAAGPDGRQQAHGHAQPPRGWLPQPANRVPETSWQTPDQQFQPAFPIIFRILPRSSGQCRAGGVSRDMDSQKSDSFLHEPRRTSDAETVEKRNSRLDRRAHRSPDSRRTRRETRRSDITRLDDTTSSSSPEGPGSITWSYKQDLQCYQVEAGNRIRVTSLEPNPLLSVLRYCTKATEVCNYPKG